MKKNQQGTTLVELMISLLLGLLVAGLAIQLFFHVRHGQSAQQASSYFQESVRHVIYRLGPLLRNAGYRGCGASGRVTVAGELHGSVFDMTAPFGGGAANYRGHSYWALRFVVPDKLGAEVTLAETMNPSKDALVIGGFTDSGHVSDVVSALNVTKVALVTNCDSADVFRLASIAPEDVSDRNLHLVAGEALSRIYGGNSGAMASSYIYPLRRWELRLRDQAGGAGRPALFLVNLDAPSGMKYVELVSGVEDYVVTVSLDTDGDGQPDTLNQAPASLSVASWPEVVRVELSFSLYSQPGVVPGGSNEGRLRREFQFAFSPRNL
ncbi:prepilin-type N-terminal cleavage/methylation domain-containing protein [Halomonas halocynthiae]|uniref:prepilin-type N-terminal cleavage/methylation domain-containing protein n=1 Tax=Halomonas halocynthiae TaxID=176290 RepID=UPI0004199DDB|nr:prepilin-type N-terminal cleavage/methylation domain-containing protein [Halomonas halocynthiae]